MTEHCQDKLSIYLGEGEYFSVYCCQSKGHPGNHLWTGNDGEGRKITTRWTQSVNSKKSSEENKH